jgi:hypothetical protein
LSNWKNEALCAGKEEKTTQLEENRFYLMRLQVQWQTA